MEVFNPFDGSILLWIQDNVRADALTPIVNFITHLGDKGIFWIALTLILLIFKKTRRVGVICAIAMTIGLLFTNLVIKNWVARPRPYVEGMIDGLKLLIEEQHDWSFPSGHTTNSFAAAWVIFRRTTLGHTAKAPAQLCGVLALVLAILISLSRLYVGVHYPTDIIGGLVIGIGSAEIALALWKILYRHNRQLIKKYM